MKKYVKILISAISSWLVLVSADPVEGDAEKQDVTKSIDKWTQNMVENIIALTLLGVLFLMMACVFIILIIIVVF